VSFEVRPLRADNWSDLVDLFSRRGPRGGMRNTPAYGCWCMYWRDRSLAHGEPKERGLAKLARAGRETGLLAYDGDNPVGWVSIAPREEYAAILASPQYRPHDEDEGVWAIVCFVVDKPEHGKGVREALLRAAVDHALARGATAVEAYPHVSAPHDYMGGVELYQRAGFVHARDAGKRAVVRLPQQ
jgi:GNAT superfamily N-acetyltransferase